MRFYLKFLFFFTSLNASSQDYKQYYQNINMPLSVKLSVDSTIYYYQKAFECAVPFPEDVINYCGYLFMQNKIVACEENLSWAISLGYQYFPDTTKLTAFGFVLDYSESLNFIDTTSVFGKFCYQYFTKNYYCKRSEYLHKIGNEADVYDVLLALELNFQECRFLLFDAEKSKKKNKSNQKIQASLVHETRLRVQKLILENQFPLRRMSNHFNRDNINMLFIHIACDIVDDKEAEIYFELLWKLVLKGELTPHEYATIVDTCYLQILNKKRSKFGLIARRENGERTLIDIADVKNINSLRKEYLLIPLERYCEIYNTKLPKNYER